MGDNEDRDAFRRANRELESMPGEKAHIGIQLRQGLLDDVNALAAELHIHRNDVIELLVQYGMDEFTRTAAEEPEGRSGALPCSPQAPALMPPEGTGPGDGGAVDVEVESCETEEAPAEEDCAGKGRRAGADSAPDTALWALLAAAVPPAGLAAGIAWQVTHPERARVMLACAAASVTAGVALMAALGIALPQLATLLGGASGPTMA